MKGQGQRRQQSGAAVNLLFLALLAAWQLCTTTTNSAQARVPRAPASDGPCLLLRPPTCALQRHPVAGWRHTGLLCPLQRLVAAVAAGAVIAAPPLRPVLLL